jgi:ribosome-interacting GTPase 1
MEAMCKQIHHHLTKEFKYALVWGVSAKHSPQRVGLTHQLADEDVVQVRSAEHVRLGFVHACDIFVPQPRN